MAADVTAVAPWMVTGVARATLDGRSRAIFREPRLRTYPPADNSV